MAKLYRSPMLVHSRLKTMKMKSTFRAADLSIVTVTYNHESEISDYLTAIFKSNGRWVAEIVIVDNASIDGTIDLINEFRIENPSKRFQIKLLHNDENIGFTKASNQGMSTASGNILMLLNPDTQVKPDTLTQLMKYLSENPIVGIVAPQLLNSDGSVQPSCRRFPRRADVLWHALGLNVLFPKSPQFNGWKMGDFQHDNTTEVDQPQGAALMTPRLAFEDVGILDEEFPMFFSDVDWCRRYRENNWKIIYFPKAQCSHIQGTSIIRNRIPMIWSSTHSFIRYFEKYHPGFWNGIGNFFTKILLQVLAFLRCSFLFLFNKKT